MAVVVLGVIWIGAAIAWSWTQDQFYVGEQNGKVTIFRGVDADVPGVDLSTPYETTDISVDDLAAYDQDAVSEGIGVGDLAAAHDAVANLSTQDGGS
jgi:protein phosphatase